MSFNRIYIVVFAVLFAAWLSSCGSQREIASEPPQPEPEEVADEQPPVETLPEETDPLMEEMTEEEIRSSIEGEYQGLTNRALEHLVLAQIALEEGMPNMALYEINRSLSILETADAMAYKGSILFLLGQVSEAQSFWQRAFRMNPDAVHKNLPGIQEAFRQ